jgi:arylsulfatase A-like enzyme
VPVNPFPANAAIMTGMRPSSIGATWETVANDFPGQARPAAERLHDAGYYTAGLVMRSASSQ